MSEFDDRTFRLMAQNDDNRGPQMLKTVFWMSVVFYTTVGLGFLAYLVS